MKKHKYFAYYNEIDTFSSEWLRQLIKAGHIADGEVDTRSIEDVLPDDLRGFTQCHFFAGIGVWSYSLRRAGWPDERPVWTGSCPCQPFSAAGKGKGFADERHLWPAFFHLIEQCKPQAILGEQVSSPDVVGTKLEAAFVTAVWERDFDRANKIANALVKTKGFHFRKRWLDLVQSDLEGIGYTFWPEVSCACSVGAPHLRQRLYWVGESNSPGPQPRWETPKALGQGGALEPTSHVCGMADTLNEGMERLPRNGGRGDEPGRIDADQVGSASESDESCKPGPVNGQWGNADWIYCRDGKWRAVEPGTFPLAHGAPNRVGRLRGYGNAIVAPQAEAFIRAFL